MPRGRLAVGTVATGQLGQHRVICGHIRIVVAFGGPIHAGGRASVAALPLDQQRQQHHHERYLTGRPRDRTAEVLIAEKVCVPG